MKDNSTTFAVQPVEAPKRDFAVAFAERGRRIFPLVPNGKTPALEGNWRKIASSDPKRVYDMWTCPVTGAELDYNIGMALDANTLVVDVDVRNGKVGDKSLEMVEAIYEPMPDTFIVLTASKGRHFYVEVPGNSGSFPKTLATDIDLKGEGSFVVAPGSMIDGNYYAPLNRRPPAPLPACYLSMTRKKERQPVEQGELLTELDTDSAISRAIDYLTSKAPDSGTYTIAAKIKDFGISEDKAGELMLEHWRDARNLDKEDEHVLFRIHNAYRYGQNAVGISAPEAEFEAVEISTKEPPKRKGLDLHNIVDFKWSSSHTYMLQGLLNYRMLVMMSGPSNAGKSPLALDIAAHVAAGRPWRGRKVKQSYVLHFSTEGFTGLSNRMEAVKREYFPEGGTVPLDFVSGSLDLRTSASDAAAIVAAVKERSAHFGVPPGIVVIDTMSHVLGGGDESNPEHVRAVLKNCAEITKRTGAAVVLLHHPTKSGMSLYRGSSILINDTDLLISVETDLRTGIRTVTTPRVKEFAEIKPLKFKIKVVELAKDAEGDPITSVVVDWIDGAEAEFEIPAEGRDQEALNAFDEALRENGGGAGLLSFTEWSKAFGAFRAARGKKSGEAQALDRAIKRLIEGGHVQKTTSGQYVRVRPQ